MLTPKPKSPANTLVSSSSHQLPFRPNPPFRIFMVFVFAFNFLGGMVTPGSVMVPGTASAANIINDVNAAATGLETGFKSNEVVETGTELVNANKVDVQTLNPQLAAQINLLTLATKTSSTNANLSHSESNSTTTDPFSNTAVANVKVNNLASTLAGRNQALQAFGNLPLAFEAEAAGRGDNRVSFRAQGGGYNLFLTPKGEAVLNLRKPQDGGKLRCLDPNDKGKPDKKGGQRCDNGLSKGVAGLTSQGLVLKMDLVGANANPSVQGQEELPGKFNYFLGDDTNRWRSGVTNYARVAFKDVYSGIDLIYYGNSGQLEHDFVLAPGADPADIQLRWQGADRLELINTASSNPANAPKGALIIHSGTERIMLQAPVLYQLDRVGKKQFVTGAYQLSGGNGNPKVGFTVGSYDRTRPLVIDPVLSYSTYLGGSGNDYAQNITVDSQGNAYVTGYVFESNFPTTPGAYNTTLPGGGSPVFVTKLSPDGKSLVYSTFVGGDNEEYGTAIKVDSAGNAYVTGSTNSPNFPTTSNAYRSTAPGGYDVFLLKLNPTGSSLLYSTFLGGSGADEAWGLAVTISGTQTFAYVVGNTWSSNFPTSTGALRPTRGGTNDAFVTKLAVGVTGTTALQYSTYLGGTNVELGEGIAVDSNGYAYVTGYTASSNFPTTSGAYQTTGQGGEHVYVSKLNATGTALLYSTYLAGDDSEYGENLTLDSQNNVYVTGKTASTNFPTTPGAYRRVVSGTRDIFAVKLNTTLTGTNSLVYGTYLGGSGSDEGWNIAVDTEGQAYLTGVTDSANFPTTPGAVQVVYGGGEGDSFLIKLNAAGSALLYATYLGGSAYDFGKGVAVDPIGNAYLAGYTTSTNFPTTEGVPQPSNGGGERDVFVSKLAFAQLVFSTQPGGTAAGSSLNPQPVVTVKRLDGTTLTSYSGPITLSIVSGTGTSGAVLAGTTSLVAVNGVATFTNLAINLVGSGYRLSAKGNLLDSVESAPFNITTGVPASIIAMAGTPQGTLTNTVFTTNLQAKVRDSGGNSLAGVVVTFQAPASGASGSFAGSNSTSATATTNGNGIAVAPTFTANGTVGSYNVSASVSGVASPALFSLDNTTIPTNGDTNGVRIILDPAVAGPNPMGSTQTYSATVERHDLYKLAGVPLTFTVKDADTGQLVATALKVSTTSGVISYTYTYSSSTPATHTVVASTGSGVKEVKSNTATVYWLNPINSIQTTGLNARFYRIEDSVTPATAPLFTQIVPLINYTVVNGTNIPFTTYLKGEDGNYNVPLVAKGNGRVAGICSGDMCLQLFQAAFTGKFIIPQPVTITFDFYTDDYHKLGIGPNDNNVLPVRVGGSLPNNYSFLTGYPAVSEDYNGNSGAYHVYSTVYFPEPGVYPYEVNYFQNVENQFSLEMYVSSSSGGYINVPTAGSITVNPTTQATLDVNQPITTTFTVKDASGAVWANKPLVVKINGANSETHTITTTSSGIATFVYTGTLPGTDEVYATGWVGGMMTSSSPRIVNWTSAAPLPNPGTTTSGCAYGPQNWLSSPANPTTTSGKVDITASVGMQTGAVVEFWPSENPAVRQVLVTTTQSTSAGTALTTLDTTTLANGAYIVRVCGTASDNTKGSQMVLVKVVGENKPGRVAFSLTDFTVPVAGLPIVVGRNYDSLERKEKGDFGYGWSLSIGNPKLKVNPAGDVTITTLDGKRVTFYFTPGTSFFGYGAPGYTAEAGVYGSLRANGCGAVATAGATGGHVCFPGGRYQESVSSYSYRDPYGRIYDIGADGKLLSLTDLNGNKLSYDASGIKYTGQQGAVTGFNNDPYVVRFGRGDDADCLTCISRITDTLGHVYRYDYSSGASEATQANLEKVTLPQTMPNSSSPISITYFYTNTSYPHLFTSANDPRGKQAVVTSYYPDGRLASVTDALGQRTDYSYDLPSHNITNSTSITNPTEPGSSVRGVTTQIFDSYGKPLEEIDPLGRITRMTYDAKHQLLTRLTAFGTADQTSTSYQYNDKGHQTAVTTTLNATGETSVSKTDYNPYGGPDVITDAEGKKWQVSYDDNFLPTVVTDTIGTVGGYSFDSRGSIASRVNGNGKATTFGYNTYGNKTSEADPLGNTAIYGYNSMGWLSVMTDAEGTRTSYEYDNIGRMIRTIVAFDQPAIAMTTTYEYDANGNKLKETDARGNFTSYSYDAANRLLTTTYANLSSQSYQYDWRGNRIEEKDQSGRTTRTNYDKAGQLVSSVTGLDSAGNLTPDTATSGYSEYDNAGRRVKEYNPYAGAGSLPANQPYTRYEYDTAGRLITHTNQLGDKTVYSYDKAGRKTGETDALGRVTSFEYDIRGRLTKTIYPVHTTGIGAGTALSTTVEYDGAGQVLARTDGAGVRTLYEYDEASRLRSVSLPISQAQSYYNKTSYDYDKLGRVRFIIDARSNKTELVYDELGRQTKKVWPTGLYQEWGYDRVGNRIRQRLADGNFNTFSYDNLNRLSTATYFDTGSGVRTVNYSYTPTSQRSQVTDTVRGSTPTSYAYDARDRVKSITQPASSNSLTVTYAYDASSRRTALTTKEGTTSYGYDTAHRLTSVTAPGASVPTTYTYNAIGLRTQQKFANDVKVDYSYDELNRLTKLHQYKTIPTTLAAYTYTLGLAGNRTRVDEYEAVAGGGSNTRINQWSYDDSYRLLSESRQVNGGTATTATYSYDKTGNRLSLVTTGLPSVSYSYNELDQLVSTQSGSISTQYGYDRRGNLKQLTSGASVTSYTWDAADRLVGAVMPGGGTASYTYDHDNRRVRQVAGGTTTNYLWDEQSSYGDVLLETDTAGAIQTSYVLGGTELVSQKKAGTPSYFLTDGQGSTRNLTDSSGALVSGQQYSYDAFGKLLSGQTTPVSNYLYTGQQFDPLTSLYSLRARYYNPGEGRFLSRDTWPVDYQNPVELNRYGYTANDPLNFTDPTGYVGYSLTLGSAEMFSITGSALVKLGFAVLGLVTAVIGVALLLPEATRLYDKARVALRTARDAAVQRIYNFTVVVAQPIITDGTTQKLIAVSNYYSDGWDKAYEIIRSVLSLEGLLIPGSASKQPRPSSHAERLMLDYLVLTSGTLRSGQDIPGAVSNSNGICKECWKDAVNTGTNPAFAQYMIESTRKITLKLYATSLQK